MKRFLQISAVEFFTSLIICFFMVALARPALAEGGCGYPLTAWKLKEEGVVVLRVIVSVEGKPLSATIKKSSGFDILDNAAVQCAMSAVHFAPATKDGVAIQGELDVPMNFKFK